jgi:rhamnulokinase
VGIPVHAGPVEATALGNIGVQARACGLFKDLAEVRRAIAAAFPVKVYEPAA